MSYLFFQFLLLLSSFIINSTSLLTLFQSCLLYFLPNFIFQYILIGLSQRVLQLFIQCWFEQQSYWHAQTGVRFRSFTCPHPFVGVKSRAGYANRFWKMSLKALKQSLFSYFICAWSLCSTETWSLSVKIYSQRFVFFSQFTVPLQWEKQLDSHWFVCVRDAVKLSSHSSSFWL